MAEQPHSHALAYTEPEKIKSIDSEFLSGKRYDYQEDISLVEDVDLMAATPGQDLNWLEDIHLLEEDGVPAVFDRYSNCFVKIHFPIPAGRRGRDRAQGAHQAPAVGQLLRHPAEGDPLQVPAARARPVGRGLGDGGHRLGAPRARGLGEAGRALSSLRSVLHPLERIPTAGRPPGRNRDKP